MGLGALFSMTLLSPVAAVMTVGIPFAAAVMAATLGGGVAMLLALAGRALTRRMRGSATEQTPRHS